MSRLDPRKVGSPSAPSLTQKEVSHPSDEGGVSDPAARSYAERARLRKSSDVLKQSKVELGHGPPVSMEKGKAIKAMLGGGLPQPGFPIVAETQASAPPPPSAAPPSRPRRQTPPVMPGVGGGYAFNRAMASGAFNRPVTLSEAKEMEEKSKRPDGQTGLSPQTVEALKMAQANASAQESRGATSPEREVAEAMREEAQPEGDLDVAERKIVEERTKKESEDDRPALDFEALGAVRFKLMSKKRRQSIEGRLEEMDLSDMIMKRELQQVVPVVAGKLEITLRTQSQRENLWCLQYIYDFSGSNAYQQELLSTCRLACSLVSINGKMLPDHRKDIGQSNESVDKAAFKAKLDIITGYPVQFIADMSVQHIWFEDRVNDLFGLDAIKNG